MKKDKKKKKDGFLFRAAAGVLSFCFVAAATTATTANAPTDGGGFYFSEYLQQSTPLSSQKPASYFTVSQTDTWHDGGRRILTRTEEAIDNLPLTEYFAEAFVNDDESAALRARENLSAAGWQLGADVIREGALSAAQNVGGIRRVDVNINSEYGRGFAHVGLDAIGALHETEDGAAAWQVRAYSGFKDSRAGGNLGLLLRTIPNDNVLLGGNAFVDYERYEKEHFFRWSVGGEMRSGLIDVFANYYDAISDEKIVEDSLYYISRGYDAEAHWTPPDAPQFTAIAGYYSWEGEYDHEDEDGLLVGGRVSMLRAPLVLRVEYRTGAGRNLGGRLAFLHEFGGKDAGSDRGANARIKRGLFRPHDYLFAPVEREYTQRIRTVAGFAPQSIARVAGLRGAARMSATYVTDIPRHSNVYASAGSIEGEGNLTIDIGGVLSGVTLTTDIIPPLPWQLPPGASVTVRTESDSDIIALHWNRSAQQATIFGPGGGVLTENGMALDVGTVAELNLRGGFALRLGMLTVWTAGSDAAVIRVQPSNNGGMVSVRGVFTAASAGQTIRAFAGEIHRDSATDMSFVYNRAGNIELDEAEFRSGNVIEGGDTFGCDLRSVVCSGLEANPALFLESNSVFPGEGTSAVPYVAPIGHSAVIATVVAVNRGFGEL